MEDSNQIEMMLHSTFYGTKMAFVVVRDVTPMSMVNIVWTLFDEIVDSPSFSLGMFVSRNWSVSDKTQLQQNHLRCLFQIVSRKMHLQPTCSLNS